MTIEEAEQQLEAMRAANEEAKKQITEQAEQIKGLSEKYEIVANLNDELYKKVEAAADKAQQHQDETAKHIKECRERLSQFIKR